MGQAQSIADNVLPGAVDTVHMEVVRHAKVFSEMNALTYEDFKACLENLNTLSRKCIDPNGKQLVFLVKKGTDTSLLWKATVRIVCVKVHPETHKIDTFKFLNLKQFLCVFNTFQSHLETLMSSEQQRSSRRGSHSPLTPESAAPAYLPITNRESTASVFMDQVNSMINSKSGIRSSSVDSSSPSGSTCSHLDHFDECSICLDRRTEVILPCAHSFCAPCIEQWNVNNKTCPICLEILDSTDETWVLSDFPGVEEINEKICAEFITLLKNDN